MMENQSYTCPNPSCGKVFTSPIKAENLRSKKAEAYDACPFCLTEITLESNSVPIEEKEDLEKKKPKSEQTNEYSEKVTMAESPPKEQKCTHQFGYLSKRSTKEKIPEECMMCENIVQCMLKNVTG
jgi:hypothetical protein